MRVTLAFRSLLILEVLLSVAVLPLTVAISAPLPRDLALYLGATSRLPVEGPLTWVMVLLEAMALLGLFFFVRGARELYVAMIGVSLAQTLYQGTAAVLPSTVYAAVLVERLVTGTIIGFAYGSPVAGRLRIGGTDHRGGEHAAHSTGGDAVEQ